MYERIRKMEYREWSEIDKDFALDISRNNIQHS